MRATLRPAADNPARTSFVRAVVDWAASSPIIDGVLFGSPDGDVPGPPVCAVALARGFAGFGKGTTRGDALISALGEALEQYAASRVSRERLIRSTFRELAEQAFDPRWLCLYTEAQYDRPEFPFPRFDPDSVMTWLRGRWTDSGEAVWLPAFATCLGDGFRAETLCQVTSNGLAAGGSVEDAACRASCELYERDAFLRSWIALQPPAPASFEDLDPAVAEVIAHLQSRGASIHVYVIDRGAPVSTAVCVALGDGQTWPAVTLGLGAGVEEHCAIEKAILEQGQTGPFLARVWRNNEAPVPAAPENIRTLQDHALYYCDPNHAREFNEWLRNPGTTACGGAVRNIRIAIADLTPPELEESPFRVVRALGRGLQPIYYGHGFERSYTPRLSALLQGHQPNLAPPPIC